MVTGSNFLLESEGVRILVDCGLVQGKHTAEADNWEKFPYDPKGIDFLIVTHSHIDHIGKIPKLVKDGFRGKIISTKATKALAEPMLLDSMELLLHDAHKHGRESLYDEKDISQALGLWGTVPYHERVELKDAISVEFLEAGHILGSAMLRFTRDDKTIVFTGDLGGGNSPLLSLAEVLHGVDYLVIESVYGDRVRADDKNRREILEDVIENAVRAGGTLLIPAFSTERTQDLLFEVRSLMVEKRVRSVPVYVDSPLAQKITEAFLANPEYFSKEIEERIRKGEKIFDFPELTFVKDIEHSAKIREEKGSKIIIAGSGMSTGGRVHGHEKAILPDSTSTLLIVGYQAAGSLGRRLIEGEKKVRIGGEEVPVRCKVEAIYGYSAHMDGEQLLEFVNVIGKSLKEVFVVMGEPASSNFLVQRIRDYLGVKASAPEAGDSLTIEL